MLGDPVGHIDMREHGNRSCLPDFRARWLSVGGLGRLSQWALFGMSGYFILAVVSVSLLRLAYPFELEWMEGGSLIALQRILMAQPLYVEPTFDYVAHIYPPLYYYLAAVLAKIIGSGFLPLRIVSFIASLATLALLFELVRIETRRFDAAFISAGFYAATYRFSGAWFDVARVDALFLALFLAAVFVLRFRQTCRSAVLGGILLALSFHTKQTLLVMAAPVIVGVLITNWRRGLVLVVTAGGVGGVMALVLNGMTRGWYSYFVYFLPSRHGVSFADFIRFTVRFFQQDLAPLAIVCLVIAVWLASWLITGPQKHLFLGLCATGGMLGVSWAGRLNDGYANVLLPACAGIALLCGLAYGSLTAPDSIWRSPWRKGVPCLCYCALILQLWFLHFDLRAQVPTLDDLLCGQALVERLQEFDGKVVVASHPYILGLAGKETHAHRVAIEEFIGRFGGPIDAVGRLFVKEMENDIRKSRFSALIFDFDPRSGKNKPGWTIWFADLEGLYEPTARVFGAPDVFTTVTGARRRPQCCFLPVSTNHRTSPSTMNLKPALVAYESRMERRRKDHIWVTVRNIDRGE